MDDHTDLVAYIKDYFNTARSHQPTLFKTLYTLVTQSLKQVVAVASIWLPNVLRLVKSTSSRLSNSSDYVYSNVIDKFASVRESLHEAYNKEP